MATKIDGVTIAKKTVSIVVGFGITEIVRGFVETSASPKRLTGRIAVMAARVAITGLITHQVEKYTDARIDSIVDKVKEVLNEGKRLADESETAV
jgi:hypothetical protein